MDVSVRIERVERVSLLADGGVICMRRRQEVEFLDIPFDFFFLLACFIFSPFLKFLMGPRVSVAFGHLFDYPIISDSRRVDSNRNPPAGFRFARFASTQLNGVSPR